MPWPAAMAGPILPGLAAADQGARVPQDMSRAWAELHGAADPMPASCGHRHRGNLANPDWGLVPAWRDFCSATGRVAVDQECHDCDHALPMIAARWEICAGAQLLLSLKRPLPYAAGHEHPDHALCAAPTPTLIAPDACPWPFCGPNPFPS